MNTKIIMILSSAFMGIIGVVTTFLPHEIVELFSLPTKQPLPLLIQVFGGLYFGFGMLNWMAKGNAIGGIYSRPVAVGNLTHFAVVFLALIKVVSDYETLSYLWPLVVIYATFSILFAKILFSNPK